jgi:hypothetical protein
MRTRLNATLQYIVHLTRFQASVAKEIIYVLFWVITQRIAVITSFWTLENGTDMLSRNVRKELPLHAA